MINTSRVLLASCFIVFVVLSSACSTMRESGVPVPEMDTTETGIATGIVLGAGMGAVIGATAGQAGAGALVGGVAGGTTGGVIGKALENNEKRIDAHDSKLGMDTRPGGGASVRSRIWAPADEPEFAQNRPSGNKGIASRHIEANPPALKGVKERDLSSTSSLPMKSYSPQTTQKRHSGAVTQIQREGRGTGSIASYQASQNQISRTNRDDAKAGGLPLARTMDAPVSTPRIELQKPRPELPVAQNQPAVRTPVRPSNSNASSSNAQVAKNAISTKTTPDSRARMAEPKKTESPQSVNQHSKKTITPSSSSPLCDKGKNEVSRARSASSDSDKVFYLRRAILACPEDPALRVELGKVYSRLGLKDDARKEFTKALDYDPSNESAQDELSIMMLDSHSRN
jgi:hypothetical protein